MVHGANNYHKKRTDKRKLTFHHALISHQQLSKQKVQLNAQLRKL